VLDIDSEGEGPGWGRVEGDGMWDVGECHVYIERGEERVGTPLRS
jgi:hypothetical protein